MNSTVHSTLKNHLMRPSSNVEIAITVCSYIPIRNPFSMDLIGKIFQKNIFISSGLLRINEICSSNISICNEGKMKKSRLVISFLYFLKLDSEDQHAMFEMSSEC